MIKPEEFGISLRPSLLAANIEAVRLAEQITCPSPTDAHLGVAKLSRDKRAEILVVNPTDVARRLYWQTSLQSR